MKIKNSADDDEFIELLESPGLSLSDADKQLIRRTRENERYARESLPAEQQLRHRCRLGYFGRALVQRSLSAYLAVCRKNAAKPTRKGVIDIKQIYESRRTF